MTLLPRRLRSNWMAWVLLGAQALPIQAKTLSATGIYSPEVRGYDVLYPLWSDGLQKKRWLYLPPTTKIDNQDANRWRFPVGTKFWKEFSHQRQGELRRIETRLIEKGPHGWKAKTYLWNEEGTEAFETDGMDIPNYYDMGNGVFHHIPGKNACLVCHQQSNDESWVIGFSAIQLSGNHQPLNLKKLWELGLLEQSPPENVGIKAPTPAARMALGLLHGNCAHCHNPQGIMGEGSLNLQHNVLATREPGEETTVGQDSPYMFPDFQVSFKRILPGNPEGSILYRRVTASAHQDLHFDQRMPPGKFGNMSVNPELESSLRTWILGLVPLQ